MNVELGLNTLYWNSSLHPEVVGGEKVEQLICRIRSCGKKERMRKGKVYSEEGEKESENAPPKSEEK